MGTIADRTNTRWGKFRPYLVIMAVPFGIMGVLTFTAPDFSDTGKLVYAYITYNLLMMMYTAVNVPYSALMGVMTPNSAERTVLSSYRFVAAFVGGLIVQGSVLGLVSYFGDGNEARGWQIAMACLSGLAILLFWITFATTKERVAPPADQQGDLRRDLKDLLGNRPWLLIAGATVFQLIFIVMRNSSVVYYFKYYVKDQAVSFMGWSSALSFETLSSTFMMSGTIVTILGAVLTNWISTKLDKKTTYWLFIILSAASSVVFAFLGPQDIILIFAVNLIFSFSFGPVSVLQWAMYTDAADYSEWKNGRRATGLVMAASLFALKLGLTVGGALVGWLLSYYGFVANQEQTVETLSGIVSLMSVFPAVFGVIGGLIMMFYPLTNERMVAIEADLRSRRAEAPSA
jgi:GPH family glycoside/pentoside/hexuronide:cation symporter